jgi:hypothetical protein
MTDIGVDSAKGFWTLWDNVYDYVLSAKILPSLLTDNLKI